MPNDLTYKIYNKIPQNVQQLWGKIEKKKKKLHTKKLNSAADKIEKRLLPGSDETDCSYYLAVGRTNVTIRLWRFSQTPEGARPEVRSQRLPGR